MSIIISSKRFFAVAALQLRTQWQRQTKLFASFPTTRSSYSTETSGTTDTIKSFETAAAKSAKTLLSTNENAKSQPTRIVLKDEEIEEKHVRGWGNGGQKLNKTSSCVQLLHIPTNTMVICQDTRSLQQNRKIARKRLAEKLDHLINCEMSKKGKKILKLKARKHKQRQRAKKKYSIEVDESDKQDGSKKKV